MKRYSASYCFLFIWSLLMLCPHFVKAQNYWYCDFEDAAERELWQLNTPKNENNTWNNLWMLGQKGAYEGEYGLFLSADGGASHSYVSNSNVMLAWRVLDLEAGDYDLAMDWRCLGNGTNAFMMVAWVPESDYNAMICQSNAEWKLKTWITNNLLTFGVSTTQLRDSAAWRHSYATIKNDGTPHRLCFIWVNDAVGGGTSASIDNICIARNSCGAPTDLKVENDGQVATISWKSSAEAFNLKYRMHGSSDMQTISNITANQLKLTLPYGAYDVFIQVVCNGETSVWYSFPVLLIYDMKCFGYLSFSNEQCYTGVYNTNGWTESKFTQGKDLFSHLIYFQEGEVDLNTKDSKDIYGNPVAPLQTIPQGEIASVRVGQPVNGTNARITYDYVVDSREASVLMLKYACVLQLPNHDETQQPRFTLDIVDAETNEVLNSCTSVNFAATSGRSGWNSAVDGFVVWKDWTTVAMNLDEYDGKRVRVILTSYGCTQGGHWGYAYFTLSCSEGKIEGINCGDTPTTEFIAPEGFHYRWYKAFDAKETTLLTDGAGNPLTPESRIFHVDYRDTTTYKVDVVYITDDRCYFTLTASAVPRYPIADASWAYKPQQCKNRVEFTNTSHILTKLYDNAIGEWIDVHTATPPEFISWNFGNGQTASSEWSPVVDYPAEGGVFHVTLNASVGLCDSIFEMDITLPAIGDTTSTIDVQRCEGDSYSWQGRTYTTDTTITQTLHTKAGCDSINILRLRFVEKIEVNIDTVIPEGSTFMLGDRALTQSGEYVSEGLQSSLGCDSVVHLTLKVVAQLRVQNTYVEYPCADQHECQLRFKQISGFVNQCSLLFDDAALAVGFQNQTFALEADRQAEMEVNISLPDHVRPDWYTAQLIFGSVENGTDTVNVEFMVRYASDIIAQRWNYVLGLYNVEYNGGFDFDTYRWYRNGEPLPDANEPYYYASDLLDTNADYTVELIRKGESRGVFSCAYYPIFVTEDITVQPTTLYVSDVLSVSVPEEAVLQIYDVMGNCVYTTHLLEGLNQVQPRLRQGCYVARVTTLQTAQCKTLMLQGR